MTQDNLSILLAKGQINAIEFYNLFKNRHPPPATAIKPAKSKNNRPPSTTKARFDAYQQQQPPPTQRSNYIVSNILHNERIKQIRQKFHDQERLRDYHLQEHDDIFQLSSDDAEMSCSTSSWSSSSSFNSSSSCSSSSTKISRRPIKPGCEIYQVSPYTSQITFNLKISIMQTEVTDIMNVLKEVELARCLQLSALFSLSLYLVLLESLRATHCLMLVDDVRLDHF